MAIWPKLVRTLDLSAAVVDIALDHCDAIAPVLKKHDSWTSHYLTRQAARRRAATCAVFVAYVHLFDRHQLRARTLIVPIDSIARHRPEFAGTDIAGHLRMYDQDRVDSVIRHKGRWHSHEWDGYATMKWFAAIFFDSNHSGESESAFYQVSGQIFRSMRSRLLDVYWVDW